MDCHSEHSEESPLAVTDLHPDRITQRRFSDASFGLARDDSANVMNMNAQTYYVYMLTNEYNNVLYIGVTNNLTRRVHEHQSGLIDGFTRKYNIHKLVWYESCHDIRDAIAREKQLKGWIRRKKESLINAINPAWSDLSK